MSTEIRLPEEWTEGERPASLFRRFEFAARAEELATAEEARALTPAGIART